MIKLNLLNDVAGGRDQVAGGVSLETTVAASSRDESEIKTDLIIKFVFIVVPMIVAYLYRNYEINQREAQVVVLQTNLNQINDKLKSYDPGLKDLDKFKEEKAKLDAQLDVIKKLSKERLKNVKSLAALQDLIPPRVWLSNLRIIENRVELEGFATDDIVISDFMKDLEASIFFQNVALESSEETKRDEGAVKKFFIKANLENL